MVSQVSRPPVRVYPRVRRNWLSLPGNSVLPRKVRVKGKIYNTPHRWPIAHPFSGDLNTWTRKLRVIGDPNLVARIFSGRPLGHGYMRADPTPVSPRTSLFWHREHVDSKEGHHRGPLPASWIRGLWTWASSRTLTWWLAEPLGGLEDHGHV